MNEIERIGVSKVQLIVYEQLHWIFREQPIDDCGIDAHIELKNDNYATGKLIAVQIKSGESYFENESNNEVVYYIDEKHLNYWKSNVLPVIIVLYNPETEECIWEYIGRVKEKNKMCICKSHRFNENAKKELLKIANIEPYKIAQVHRKTFVEQSGSIDVLKDFTFYKKENSSCKKQIAIDFGTTKTMLGLVSENGEVSFIKTNEGKIYFDTVIGFDENYQYYVGIDALKRIEDPNFILIRNFKREVGLNKQYQIYGLKISADDIITLFLWSIINYAELKYNIYIEACWISIPVNFSYNQIKVYKQCINNCNLRIIRNITESSCVPINEKNFNENLKDDDNETLLIIFDMGGGTFDITIAELFFGVLEIVKVFGDRAIGGCDYDVLISKYIKDNLKKRYPEILIDSFIENQIRIKAEEIKFQLTLNEEAKVIFSDCYFIDKCDTCSFYYEMDRKEFKNITKELNDKVKKIISEVRKVYLNFIENEKYNDVKILIGGLGCKIFTVQEILITFFPDVPMIDNYADKAVVEGLSKYSGKLLGLDYAKNMLLLDISSCDLALMGEEIFYKNDEIEEKVDELLLITRETIPKRKTHQFTIKNKQKLSVMAICGSHQEIVKTITLGENSKDITYEIMVSIDSDKSIDVLITNAENQISIMEFRL